MVAAVCAVLSLGSIFSERHIIFDLGSHFRVQYIVLLIPMALFAVFRKLTIASLIIFLVLAVHGYAVAMSVLPESVKRSESYSDIRIVSSNLLFKNQEFDAYIEQIRQLNPDIITLQEYSEDWHKAMLTELQDYPHRITHAENQPFGIALYSKYPIKEGDVVYLGNTDKPSVNVNVHIDDRLVQVITTHPPPPSASELYDERNALMQGLAAVTSEAATPVIVTGDFNATPWTAHFTNMERNGKLRSARKGFGILVTWPNGFWPLSIPIDHVLVSKNVEVLSLETLDSKGSDHFGLVSDLRVYGSD